MNTSSPPQFESIPKTLQGLPQWIMWRREQRDGRETKVPRTIRGDLARSNDPSTWATFTDARLTFDAQPGRFDGVGFVVTADSGLVCFDFDDCIDADGRLSPNVADVLNDLNTYCEISPSGRGIRVIATGTTPESERKTTAIEGAKELIIWSAGRYTTVTGDVHELSGDGIQPRQAQIDQIWQRYFPPNAHRDNGDTGIIERTSPPLDDDDLIRRAREAKNGAKFARLFDDGEDDDAASDSEKDFRLAGRLGFWTQDVDQIDRLMRRSALDRDKFDRRDKDGTYLRRTIFNVLCKRQNDNAEVWRGPVYRPDPNQGTTTGGDNDGKELSASDGRPPSSDQPKQADALIALCLAHATLWHSPGADGEPFLSTEIHGHREHWSLGSRRYKRWLGRMFFAATRRAPNAQAMLDATGVLCGLALYDGDEHTTHIRIAECDDTIFLDLADDDWQVIAITRTGWQVINDPPVKFLRAGGMSPLPRPNPAGNIDALRDYLNVACEDDFILLVGYLVAAFRPRGPYPVLALYGEQGSAKSTTSRVIRSLIDPSKAALRTVPREERDLLISASRSWLLAFDNLAGLRPWLSDGFCRLASGGGFSARRLYSDCDEVIIEAQRPLLVNGIEELSSRPDLLDRCITVTLPRIFESRRMTESDFWKGFNRVRPDILGGLLRAVSMAMNKFDTTHLPAPPRMADAATWVTAAEDALPWESGRFVSAYARNRQASHLGSVEASPVGPAVLKLARDHSVWHGRPCDLLTAISTDQYSCDEDRHSRDWPKSPTAIGNAMRRLAPALRACGLGVDFGFETDKKSRYIHIEKDHKQVSEASEVSGASVIPRSESESAICADTLGHQADACLNAECPAETGISEPESPSTDTSDTSDTQMCAQSMHGQDNNNDWGTI